MSTYLRLHCESCGVDGPVMRFGFQNGYSARLYGYPGAPDYGTEREDAQTDWGRFVEEHEYHDLTLKWS